MSDDEDLDAVRTLENERKVDKIISELFPKIWNGALCEILKQEGDERSMETLNDWSYSADREELKAKLKSLRSSHPDVEEWSEVIMNKKIANLHNPCNPRCKPPKTLCDHCDALHALYALQIYFPNFYGQVTSICKMLNARNNSHHKISAAEKPSLERLKEILSPCPEEMLGYGLPKKFCEELEDLIQKYFDPERYFSKKIVDCLIPKWDIHNSKLSFKDKNPDDVKREIFELCSRPHIYLIYGARNTGKTSFCRMITDEWDARYAKPFKFMFPLDLQESNYVSVYDCLNKLHADDDFNDEDKLLKILRGNEILFVIDNFCAKSKQNKQLLGNLNEFDNFSCVLTCRDEEKSKRDVDNIFLDRQVLHYELLN